MRVGIRLRAMAARITRIVPPAALLALMAGTMGARNALAQTGGLAILVVDVAADGGKLDAASLRQSIGHELGVIAIAPDDPRAIESRGTIRVSLDGAAGHLEVTFEERRVTTRQVPAPLTSIALEKAATYLAGNLARHEGSDLAAWLERKQPAPSRPVPPLEAESAEVPPAAAESRSFFHRVWFSATVEMDIMYFVTANCGYPEEPYACVNADGSNRGGVTPMVPDGIGVHNSRVMIGGDYPVTDRWLVGARLGWGFRRYPGELGSGLNLGRFHIEARTEYVFGSFERWAAPFVLLGAGAANFDGEQDLPGTNKAEAWALHGPLFVTAGLGLHIPFSRDVGANLAWKGTFVFPSDALVIWAPEASLQFRL